METDLMHGCATRHAQAPLPQPLYSFAAVPKAKKDLEGSKLHEIRNREHFHEAMGEMVLLCKEAMRRKPGKQPGAAKPLSLEYLADRLDIDDPCFGYLLRTGEKLDDAEPNWRKGMLQGFITVTTFTNWQHSFMWDSMNSVAYENDDPELEGLPERIRDLDGSMAQELQSTVHCGDIFNEGIVWPRIAEISLLGGIGSGKALVEMVIEQMECMIPTPTQNYDYVVLQATENSISFYESIGFVRVGAVMLGGDAGRKESAINSFISCAYETYEVRTAETLTKIASKFAIDVLDLIFLNRHILQNAKPSSKPLLKSVLMIPKKQTNKPTSKKHLLDHISWHVAKEDETPRGIAHMYGVKIANLVKANRGRFPELLANSRLKAGTRIKVSHFDVLDTEYKAYAHWSFPDKLFEDPEPSYMMARKLKRRTPNDRNIRPFQESLKAEICDYEKPELLLPPSPERYVTSAPSAGELKSTAAKRPLTAYMAFALDMKSKKTGNLSASEIRQLWNDLLPVDKAHFEQIARESREQDHGVGKATTKATPKQLLSTGQKSQNALYNKVVRLKPDAITDHPEYTYWYVLTFIPDLKWCHLAPMYQDGVFGADKPRVEGQPRWRLVDEDLGKEVDISSSCCIPVKSRSMRKTLDADKEEWHIIDDETDPAKFPITPRDLSQCNGNKSFIPPIQESPSLLAYFPESSNITTVTVVGKALFADDEHVEKRGRGRPQKNARLVFATEPRHRIKRPTVQFDIPASARKAAALRTAAGLGPKLGIPNDSRRKSAPPTCHDAGASTESSQKRGRGRPPKRKLSVHDDTKNSTNLDVASHETGKEKVNVKEGGTASPVGSRLRSLEASNCHTSSDQTTLDKSLQTTKRSIKESKIFSLLRKTPEATEYFEPVIFESRLRGKTSHSPSISAAQSLKANIDASKRNIEDEETSGTGRPISSSEQTSGDYVETRLKRKASTKLQKRHGVISQPITVDQAVIDDSIQKKSSVNVSKNRKFKTDLMEAPADFVPLTLKSRLRQNNSGKTLVSGASVCKDTENKVASPDVNATHGAEETKDFVVPSTTKTRLRQRNHREADDHNNDKTFAKRNTVDGNSVKNRLRSPKHKHVDINQGSFATQNNAVDGTSVKKRLRSPNQHDKDGMNQGNVSSPRRIFSSTTVNSTPIKKILRPKRLVASQSMSPQRANKRRKNA